MFFEVVAAILLVLSVGILVAHALDAVTRVVPSLSEPMTAIRARLLADTVAVSVRAELSSVTRDTHTGPVAVEMLQIRSR